MLQQQINKNNYEHKFQWNSSAAKKLSLVVVLKSHLVAFTSRNLPRKMSQRTSTPNLHENFIARLRRTKVQSLNYKIGSYTKEFCTCSILSGKLFRLLFEHVSSEVYPVKKALPPLDNLIRFELCRTFNKATVIA